jgi:hypothetical protein
MKARILLVGLLVSTLAAAQMRMAPPAVSTPPPTQAPTLVRGDEMAPADPQFAELRKQLAQLRQHQTEQQEQIRTLKTCVAELADAARETNGGSHLADDASMAGAPLGASSDLAVGVAKAASDSSDDRFRGCE